MEEQKRLTYIDALRGYGAVMVILVHMTQRLLANQMIAADAVTTYLYNGARAVQMFYVISGFTMFLSLAKGWNGYRPYLKNGGSPCFLRTFWRYVSTGSPAADTHWCRHRRDARCSHRLRWC